MRAQTKVRNRYVVIRMTHQQLLAVHGALGIAVGGGGNVRAAKDGYEIISHAARAILRGERGSLSRAGMLYDYEVTDAEKAVKSGR